MSSSSTCTTSTMMRTAMETATATPEGARNGAGGSGGVLAAVRILTGEDDIKLEHTAAASSSQLDLVTLRLRQRLRRVHLALSSSPSSEIVDSNDALSADAVQQETGSVALELLVKLHESELDQGGNGSSSSRSGGGGSGGGDGPQQPKLDPALAQPLRKLVSLVARWCFQPALLAFDTLYAQAHPEQEAGSRNPFRARFTELPEDRPASGKDALDELSASYSRLLAIFRRIQSILPVAQAEVSSAPRGIDVRTQAGRILLEQCSSEIMDIGLRLTKAITPDRASDALAASKFIGLVVRSLSTQSALSSLSGIGRFKSVSTQRTLASSPLSPSPIPTPAFVSAVAKRMSALQLLRPDGVDALLRSSLDDADAKPELAQKIASYQNLNALSFALTEAPVVVPSEVFLSSTLAQMAGYLRVAAAPAGTPESSKITVIVLALSRLSRQAPIPVKSCFDDLFYQQLLGSRSAHSSAREDGVVVSSEEVFEAVRILRSIVEHAEPSSDFLHFVLGPILAPCFALYSHLSRRVSQMPTPGQSNKGKVRIIGEMGKEATAKRAALRKAMDVCLSAWARLAPAAELASHLATGRDSLLRRLSRGNLFGGDDAAGESGASALVWADDDQGVSLTLGDPHSDTLSNVMRGLPASFASGISLTDTADLKIPAGLGGNFPIRPEDIVKLLKDTDRTDAAKLLLQSLLDSYVANRSSSSLADPSTDLSGHSDIWSIILLQMIMQLFEVFGESLLRGETTSILAFIDYTLSPTLVGAENEADPSPVSERTTSQSGLSGLLNVYVSSSAKEELHRRSESDPEAIVTALSLLLALLEGDERLSMESTPMLGVIQAKVAPLLNSEEEEIRRLSQEAMLVLKARAAARGNTRRGSDGKASVPTPRSKGLELYQEALKLLQDPILPVRAHGLVILRDLVSEPVPPVSAKSKPKVLIEDAGQAGPPAGSASQVATDDVRPELDSALIPAIVDIFVQAIQDEESYLYLNAVQGLAAMAISFGDRVLKVLVGKYVGAEERPGRSIGQAEADRRLRIGEALLRVVQRCGARLGPNVSLIVEPLLAVLRNAQEPTALRSSVISLLGTCVEAAPLAMAAAGFSTQLVSTCLDIASLESEERSQPLSAMKRRKRKEGRSPAVKVQATAPLAGLADDDDLDDEGGDEQLQPDSALATDTRLPQLRRSALFLLTLLLSGTNTTLDTHLQETADDKQAVLLGSSGGGLGPLRMPGGSILRPVDSDPAAGQTTAAKALPPLLFDPRLLERTKTVLRFVGERDADAVVRVQAVEAQEQCGELELHLVRLVGSTR